MDITVARNEANHKITYNNNRKETDKGKKKLSKWSVYLELLPTGYNL